MQVIVIGFVLFLFSKVSFKGMNQITKPVELGIKLTWTIPTQACSSSPSSPSPPTSPSTTSSERKPAEPCDLVAFVKYLKV